MLTSQPCARVACSHRGCAEEGSRLHDARRPPGREAHPGRASNRKHDSPIPEKAPALDPEVEDAPAGATVFWLRTRRLPPLRCSSRLRA